MSTHHIKIDTAYVDAVITGIKPFEVRKNDRGYQVGDHLMMTEVGDPGLDSYGRERHWISKASDSSGGCCRLARVVVARVTYVYSGDPRWPALTPGYVVLGLGGIEQSVAIAEEQVDER